MNAQIIALPIARAKKQSGFAIKLERIISIIAEHAVSTDGSGRKATTAELDAIRRCFIERIVVAAAKREGTVTEQRG